MGHKQVRTVQHTRLGVRAWLLRGLADDWAELVGRSRGRHPGALVISSGREAHQRAATVLIEEDPDTGASAAI